MSADERLPVAALMVHLANADGHFDRRRAASGSARCWRPSSASTPGPSRALVSQAEVSENEAVDLFAFTSRLKRRLDEPARPPRR